MTLLKIWRNVNLFKNFVSYITVIPRKDTFLYYRKSQISFYEILFWCQSKSSSKQVFEWLTVSSLQFVMFGFVKNSVYTTCWIIWYLFAGLNLVFSPFYIIREICFQQKYDSWKLQLESWNTNHESLNRTLKVTLRFIYLQRKVTT